MAKKATNSNRAEWYKQWAKKNPEKIKEYQRRYRANKKKKLEEED